MPTVKKYLDLDGLRYFNQKLTEVFAGKVDKVEGKVLSTNDYTQEEKEKLSGIAAGAEANVIEAISVNGTAQQAVSKGVDITVPTNNNQLANGAGYQTASDVSDAIDAALAGITSLTYTVVEALPPAGEPGVIYLIASPRGTDDGFDEYIYVDGDFEKLGYSDIAIPAITSSEIDTILAS
ncbi:MAG: hypothetical protein IJ899_12960 [Blautia sp.]|nr:hypothetical protein [Blautia sp.]